MLRSILMGTTLLGAAGSAAFASESHGGWQVSLGGALLAAPLYQPFLAVGLGYRF
ncbi:MAG: hypothetical protein ACPL3S_01475 [Halothiobacillaceae bacterium]